VCSKSTPKDLGRGHNHIHKKVSSDKFAYETEGTEWSETHPRHERSEKKSMSDEASRTLK